MCELSRRQTDTHTHRDAPGNHNICSASVQRCGGNNLIKMLMQVEIQSRVSSCCGDAADCFNHLRGAGNFTSPGFPVSLPVQPVFCEWTIDSRVNHQIQLDFHVVDLPQQTIHRHYTSYMSFGDFNMRDQRVERRRVHGRQQSLPPFVSAGRSAWVALISRGDPRQQHQGLLIEVSYLQHGQLFFVPY